MHRNQTLPCPRLAKETGRTPLSCDLLLRPGDKGNNMVIACGSGARSRRAPWSRRFHRPISRTESQRWSVGGSGLPCRFIDRASRIGRLETDGQPRAAFTARRSAGPVVNEMDSVKHPVRVPATPQTKKITSPSSTRAQTHSVVNGALSEKESRERDGEPEMSLVEQYKLSRGQSTPEKIRRLMAIPDSIARRPIRDALSMKRQGKPLPPTYPL